MGLKVRGTSYWRKRSALAVSELVIQQLCRIKKKLLLMDIYDLYLGASLGT